MVEDDDDEEFKKLKQFNDYTVKQEGARVAFFEKLADLGSLSEGQENVAMAYYET